MRIRQKGLVETVVRTLYNLRASSGQRRVLIPSISQKSAPSMPPSPTVSVSKIKARATLCWVGPPYHPGLRWWHPMHQPASRVQRLSTPAAMDVRREFDIRTMRRSSLSARSIAASVPF